MTYNILEVANTHAGGVDYIDSLLKEFASFKKEDGFGIKFQPLKFDKIATEDYEWYDTYKAIFISDEEWGKVITNAFETKDIWLDIFDEYGIEIFRKNQSKVTGIKLQASVLYNNSVLNGLSLINLNDNKVIINIAAYDLLQIKERVQKIEQLLKPNEILIEIGFQSYPTELSDSGLSKIKEIKGNLNNRVVFADHVDGQSEHAILLPTIASLLGAEVIEKHIMHSSLETKYDGFSSITVNQYEKYISQQKTYTQLLTKPFISTKELEYLSSSIQIPILSEGLNKGSLISDNQISYKRSGKKGLNTNELEVLRKNLNILTTDKLKGYTLKLEDFKRATIATIVACRLKSTRLPRKAILPIGNYSSIELCLKNLLKFDNVNYTILATSTEDEDAELRDYIYREDVIFHRGDPDDVIERYLEIARKLKIDVVIRVTGDCPYLSNDICQFLLTSHFEKGADYTTGVGAAVGTNVEIINTEALEKVKKYLPDANYSEYMTWYFQNNPDYFNINNVNLPQKWCRDYRLTLDYNEDLDLFNKIEQHFEMSKEEYSIDNLFQYLDENPSVANLNKHLTLKYETDQTLIDTLNKVTKIKRNYNL